MFYCQGSSRKMLLGVLGVAIVVAAATPATALGSDKIAVNAKAVFDRAGGTGKNGLSQKQFQAADEKIAAAMDRLVRDGTLGGPVPPTVVFKHDLSKKEKITYPEFLEYFKGLASEQDLKVRRALVDQALAQAGAAQAAADAAMAEAQRAAADAEIARLNAQADRDRSGYDAEADRIRQENIALQQFNAELMWYLQHPNQVVPHPQSTSPSPRAANGQNTATTNGPAGSVAARADGTPVPKQIVTHIPPVPQRPPVVNKFSGTNGNGAGSKSSGPSAGSSSKDDKKPDDKPKK
jgi:hypothetical protein